MPFILLLILHGSFGQTISFSPSPIEDNSFDNIKIIGQDDDGFFLLQSNIPFELNRDRVGFKNRKYKVAYFSNDLVLRWTKLIEGMPGNATIQTIAFSQQKIIITSAIENKTPRKIILYSQWMNNKGEIILNKETGNINPEPNSSIEKARIVISANQQQMGFIIHEYLDEYKQAVHLTEVDSALTVISSKKFIINYGQKNFTATEYSLSDNRDFHLIGVRTIKDKNSERKKKEDYLIFSAPASASQFSEFLINEGGVDVTSASISFDNANNRLVCAGFYSDRKSTSGAGIIYTTLEMNKPAGLTTKTRTIDSGTQLKLLGERNSGYDIGLISYPIEKIILRNDGGAVIIAEASYTNDYSYYDYFSQSFTRRTEYHYNNIVVISVNGNGTIHWLDMIRKNQESEDDGGIFSSFCPLLTSDKLILIYNSDISRNSEVMAVHVSNTGQQDEKHIVRASEHLLLFARSGKQISENEAVIPCISKKKLMLTKFTF